MAKKEAAKKEMKIELTKAVLLAAAKDINKADIADPPIDVKGSESQLKKALLAASEIVEPEDELKPETFAVLKAVAEEDQDEDGADDADVDETEEVEDDDESEADESSLEDLTVEELQTRCKAVGIPFKAKKTTKAQLIAALEAYEAEHAEVEEDGEEDTPVPEPKAEPEKKADKAPAKPKAEKKTKAEGPGVIASILEFITEAKKGISVTQIAEKLTERFPNKQADGMLKTVKAQIGGKKSPTRMEKEKGVKFTIKDGMYSIK